MNFLHLLLIPIIIQIPQGVPNPEDGSPLTINSIADVFLYIVAPIMMVILYFVARSWRRRKKREAEERRNQEK
jgi:heme/copper-type cytochrome/quinol oxidase subunit 2